MNRASYAPSHTLEVLGRLDLLLRRETLRFRAAVGPRPDEDYRGLYVSPQEVDRLLMRSPGETGFVDSACLDNTDEDMFSHAIALADQRITSVESELNRIGEVPPLLTLTHTFGLSPLEREMVVLAMAPEIDLKYERLYAYLQDDVARRWPTVDLALRLLCPTLGERVAARDLLGPGAPLRAWRLLTLNEDPNARQPPLLARYMRLEPRVVEYLLGHEGVEPLLIPLLESTPAIAVTSGQTRMEIEPPASCLEAMSRIRLDSGDGDHAPLVALVGRVGSGRRALASCVAVAHQKALLVLDASALADQEGGGASLLPLVEREALLLDAFVAWAHADPLLSGEEASGVAGKAFQRWLRRARIPVLLLLEHPWQPGADFGGRWVMSLPLPAFGFGERRDLWRKVSDNAEICLDDDAAESLAGRFRLSPGQILSALPRARALAATRGRPGVLTLDDLDTACRSMAELRLGALATRVDMCMTWEDLILPQRPLTVLRSIASTVRHRPRVYGDWGFERRLSSGRGVVALFAGPSGTGKTLAAGVLARDLGLDLFRIDLSSVVSKYIGETERNLERIFSVADATDAILFFDEADALFGKRSEVSDARDRYANIEVAYLLQRVDAYGGLVILASNLKKNIDDAFLRRLHFVLEFPLPEEAERLAIWQRSLPPQMPRAAHLDLAFLARKFKLSGGNIRNAVVAAAFLAAEEGGRVEMRHLVQGVALELQKGGKLVAARDFEQYAPLIPDPSAPSGVPDPPAS